MEIYAVVGAFTHMKKEQREGVRLLVLGFDYPVKQHLRTKLKVRYWRGKKERENKKHNGRKESLREEKKNRRRETDICKQNKKTRKKKERWKERKRINASRSLFYSFKTNVLLFLI